MKVKKLFPTVFLTALACLCAQTAWADVKPHALFSNGMVLQEGERCPVWGTADPGEEVQVALKAKNGEEVRSKTADKDGRWRVDLQTTNFSGGPYTLTITGKNKVELQDVYVGDVWVCSGQSNMEWPVNASANAEETKKDAKNPLLRLFTVPHATATTPLKEVKGKWSECNPDTVGGFTAVGYFFGRDLQKARKVPIGLINTSWGGTRAEAWTNQPVLASMEEWKGEFPAFEERLAGYPKAQEKYKADLEKYKEEAAKAKAEGKDVPPEPKPPANPADNQNAPSVLYNGMIAPLLPFAIKGAIWYQGESNAGQAGRYQKLLSAMIQNWRDDWQVGEFPFLIVQLAPFMPIEQQPTDTDWARLREAQLQTSLKMPNVGLAVITDVGEEKDIHPKKKEPVGARLALAARGLCYGEKLVYSGPGYASMKLEDGKAILSFKHTGSGLVAKDGPLTGFTIAGDDHQFVNAEAQINGDTIVVSSPKVAKPVAVRFGWANYPVVNLWNKEGLPASPFRTDDFPKENKPK
jgi:sialate O-acetylesterase